MKINDLRVYLYTATKNASLNYISKKAKQIEDEPYENLASQLHSSIFFQYALEYELLYVKKASEPP
jgi:hypothetical protein